MTAFPRIASVILAVLRLVASREELRVDIERGPVQRRNLMSKWSTGVDIAGRKQEGSGKLAGFDSRSAAGHRPKISTRWFATGVALLCGCAAESSDQLITVEIQLESLATIHTEGQALVVDPADVTIDEQGRWVVTDRGDKAIKIFAADGESSTVGSAGAGPGQFQALVSGGLFGPGNDTVFGYDLISRVISLFDLAGNFVRTVTVESRVAAPIAFLRLVDDTLLLASGWIPPDNSPAVRLFDLEGRAVGSFVQVSKILDDMPREARTSMGVIADGRDGLIFSALFGHDTILVHDVSGRLHDAGRLEAFGDVPLLRLPELVRLNRGSLRKP